MSLKSTASLITLFVRWLESSSETYGNANALLSVMNSPERRKLFFVSPRAVLCVARCVLDHDPNKVEALFGHDSEVNFSFTNSAHDKTARWPFKNGLQH
jgi:hypothetical protein